jgi:uncharacterized membrane protein
LQEAVFEKFAAEVDPIEGEADQALALLDTIEALSAELDDFNEATMPAVEDLEVCYFSVTFCYGLVWWWGGEGVCLLFVTASVGLGACWCCVATAQCMCVDLIGVTLNM